MTLYTDEHCGIEAPHRHTGEIVQGHFVQYWCPTLSGWLDTDELYGNKCSCKEPHMKARIQETITEVIDILPQMDQNIEAYIWEELNKKFEHIFLYGWKGE